MNEVDISIIKYIYKELHKIPRLLSDRMNYNTNPLIIQELIEFDKGIHAIVLVKDDKYNYKDEYKLTKSILIPNSYINKNNRNSIIDCIFDNENDLIIEKLSEYCEFDINQLFKLNDIISIFGGSLRDIINGSVINDVDILTTTYGSIKIHDFLLNNDYVVKDEYIKKSINSLYDDIKYIHEPRTYMKGGKIIQVIRPSNLFSKNDTLSTLQLHNNMLSNVDISCCGISFNGITLHENVKNAILHAKYKKYRVYPNALMSSDKRLSDRIWKFEQRGYTAINNDGEERNVIIDNIMEKK